MNRASLAERIWYQSSVPVFGEKFVLPLLGVVVGAVLLHNPMKWDWQSRVALAIVVAAIAFLVSHQLHLRNEALRTGVAPSSSQASGSTSQSQSVKAVVPVIQQNAEGSPCSNVVAGKDATVKCSPESGKNAAEDRPKGP